MAHTKGHIKGFKNLLKPAKGITFTPFKAAYSLAKTAFRHPVLATATYLLGKKQLKEKIAKRSAFKQYNKKGKWLL